VPARGRGDDRALLRPVGDALVFAIADGAGGTANGSGAADALVALVLDRSGALAASSEAAFVRLLEEADETSVAASGGQTTAVVGVATAGRIVGASVGDSGAILFREPPVDLTSGQTRKPLLGSGNAEPRGFAADWNGEPLLVATDGLLRYAGPRVIGAELAMPRDCDSTARRLVDLARLPSGTLPDDVALAIARIVQPR
jgi:hypothetical protein